MGEIRVTCKTADSLPHDQIELLQGRLKKRTDEQQEAVYTKLAGAGYNVRVVKT